MTVGGAVHADAQSIRDEINHFRVYPHLDRAYRLISGHDIRGARQELEICLNIDASDAAVWSTYLDVLYQLHEYEQIVISWRRLGALQDDTRLRRYHLLAELERQDGGAALEDLHALAASPGRMTKGELQDVTNRFVELARERRQPELLRALMAALPKEALSASALFRVGGVFRALGSQTDANAAYDRVTRAADAGSLRLDAYRALASAAVEQQQWANAWQYLSRIHALEPTDVPVLRLLGDVAASRGSWSEAVKWYRLWLKAAHGTAADERYRIELAIGHAESQLRRDALAAASFTRALRAKPNDVAALTDAAQALERAGRTTAAIARLRAVLRVAPSGDSNAAVGFLYSRLGQPAKALPYLERARDLGVSDSAAASVLGQLGYAYAALDRQQQACAAFAAALELAPNEAALHAALGRTYLALHDEPSAVEHFERSLAAYDDPEVWQALGLAFARAGDEHGVSRVIDHLDHLGTGISHDRSLDATLWRALAERAFEHEEFGESADSFRRAAMSVGATGWRDLARAAECLERAGRLSEAVEIWSDIARSPQADRESRSVFAERVGYAAAQLGQLDVAARSFQLAIGLGRDSWRLHLDLALALSRMGRWPAALEEALTSVAQHDTARGRIAAGVCYKALDKPDLAVVQFARSLSVDEAVQLEAGDRKYVLDELTYLYVGEGSLEEAASAARRSLAIANDPRISLELARIERRLGNRAAAAAILASVDATSLSTSMRVDVLDAQARIDAELGDIEAAAQALKAAVTLEPSAARLFQLGLYYRQLGNLDWAISCLSRSVAVAPDEVQYRAALAYADLQAGRLGDAVESLKRVVQQQPDNLQGQQDLAYALIRIGDEAAAIGRLRQAIDSTSAAGELSPDTDRGAAVARMRGTLAQLEKRYDGSAYYGYHTFVAPNTTNQPAALLLSQAGFDLSRSLSGAQPRWSAFGRLMTMADQPLGGVQTGGTLQEIGIGIRYKPFRDENFNMSAERLIAMGNGPPGSWLLRALFSKERGAGLQPGQGWQPYSLLYGDVAAFLGPYPSTLAYGEARLGLSRTFGGSLVVRPHVLAIARDQPAGLGSGEAFQFAAGIGFTYYLNDLRDPAHRTSLETRIYGSGALAGASDTGRADGIKGLTVATSVHF